MLSYITFRRVLFCLIFCGLFYTMLCYVQMSFYAAGFDDFIDSEVKFAPTRETTKDDIVAHILDASRQFGVALGPRDIRVKQQHNSNENIDTLMVDVNYVAPIKLDGFKFDVHFHRNATVSY